MPCFACAGKQTRRSARVPSVRESFRQRSGSVQQSQPAASDPQPSATAQDAAPADKQPKTAAARAAALQQGHAALQHAAASRHNGAAAGGTAATADALASQGQHGSTAATASPAVHGRHPVEEHDSEHQAGLVPYSSSEGGDDDDSDETLTDAIVISDKIVSRAATNTAQDVGDDVRGFGSDEVRPPCIAVRALWPSSHHRLTC